MVAEHGFGRAGCPARVNHVRHGARRVGGEDGGPRAVVQAAAKRCGGMLGVEGGDADVEGGDADVEGGDADVERAVVGRGRANRERGDG